MTVYAVALSNWELEEIKDHFHGTIVEIPCPFELGMMARSLKGKHVILGVTWGCPPLWAERLYKVGALVTSLCYKNMSNLMMRWCKNIVWGNLQEMAQLLESQSCQQKTQSRSGARKNATKSSGSTGSSQSTSSRK